MSVESPFACIPDHGVIVFCYGCADACAVCRDADDLPVLWPCEQAGVNS